MPRFAPLSCLLALVLGLSAAGAAGAAEIETVITPAMAEMGCTLRLSGPIEDGDARRLAAALQVVPPVPDDDPKADLSPFWRNFAPAVDFGHLFFTHRLCLNSPGGPAEAADRIVSALNSARLQGGGVPTAIARGDRCAGTCAVVFLTGRFAFLPGHEGYDGMSAANALLNPEGVLDLGGMVEPGPDALAQAARLVARMQGGSLLVEPGLLARAFEVAPGGSWPVARVGDAVAWGIAVEPNPLHLGQSPGEDADLAANLCAHAAERAPNRLALSPRDGQWHDVITGRAYTCTPGAGFPQSIRSFLDNPAAPGAPRPRLHTTCEARAVFRPAGGCDGFECGYGAEVALPCLAYYPRRMRLSALAVPLP